MATLPIGVPGSLQPQSRAPPLNEPVHLDVQHVAARTLWGITFIGLGLGVTAAAMVLALSFLPLLQQSGGTFFAALGFPLLTLYPGIFGRPHVQRVRVAFAFAVTAVVVGGGLWLLGPSRSDMNVSASSLRLQLLGGTLFVLLASVAVYLAIDQLATRSVRRVAVAALAAAFVVQVVAYIVVNDAIDANLPLGFVGWDTPPLSDVQKTWAWWGALNAIPLLLFLVAYEFTYWHLRRELIGSLPITQA